MFKSDLSIQFVARIGLFRKDVDSFEIAAKADMPALSAYVGRDNPCVHDLAG
jgi:hypothetical protein